MVVEFANAILEFANGGDAESPRFARRPIQTPLVRFRVVEAQREPFNVSTAWAVCFELLEVGASSPHLLRCRRAVELLPLLRASQGMEQPRQVDLPSPDL